MQDYDVFLDVGHSKCFWMVVGSIIGCGVLYDGCSILFRRNGGSPGFVYSHGCATQRILVGIER